MCQIPSHIIYLRDNVHELADKRDCSVPVGQLQTKKRDIGIRTVQEFMAVYIYRRVANDAGFNVDGSQSSP